MCIFVDKTLVSDNGFISKDRVAHCSHFTLTPTSQLYLYFMWTCIELAAALLMFFISRFVEDSLEKFKMEEIKGVHEKEDAKEANKMDELHEVEEQKS